MRNRVSVVLRLFVMLVMALGLGALMTSPAAAQTSTSGTCQSIVGGVINQSPGLPCTIEIDSAGQCQLIVGGNIYQNAQGCGVQSCPRQIILDNGDIFQFTCGSVPATATNVPATATNVPATATIVPATATHVPATDVPATHVPATDVPATHAPATNVPATDVPDDDGGQANPPEEEVLEVSVLPETGQGPDNGQSGTANILMLGAMGMVLTLGAVALRLRKNG